MKEQGWEGDSGFIERVESFITPSYLSLAPRKGRLVWTIDSARRYNGTKKESIPPEWLLSGVSAFYFLFSLCSSRLCVFHSNVALLLHEEKTVWLLSRSNHTPHGSFLEFLEIFSMVHNGERSLVFVVFLAVSLRELRLTRCFTSDKRLFHLAEPFFFFFYLATCRAGSSCSSSSSTGVNDKLAVRSFNRSTGPNWDKTSLPVMQLLLQPCVYIPAGKSFSGWNI